MSLMESNNGAGGRGAQRAVGERSAVAAGRAAPTGAPDPELVERPKRRRFTAEYKLRIVREADACTRPGEVGALLRREGLYSSHVAEWRKARDAGARDALAPKGKARRSPAELEVERLRRRNERLETDLARTRLALEITGKAHALLELLSESADTDSKSKP